MLKEKEKEKKGFKYTIYKRPGADTLYLRMLGKRYSTGIRDTPEGRRAAVMFADYIYNKHIEEITGLTLPEVKKAIPKGIKDLADIYLETFTNERTKNIKTQALKYLDYEENYELNKQNLIVKLDKFKANKRLNVNTKAIYIATIKAMVRYFVDREYIEPINLKTYKFDYSSDRYNLFFTDEEVEKILNCEYVKSRPEYYYLLRFLRVSGFRIGETLRMTWEDINFDNKLIRIHNKVKQNRLQYFPITEEIKQILESVSELKGGSKTGNVFNFKYETTKARLSNVLKSLGIKREHLNYHGFRRSFTNKLINSDVPIEQASELLRHSDINLTVRTYKQHDPNRLRNTLENVKF